MTCVICSLLCFVSYDVFAQDDDPYLLIKENVIEKNGATNTVRIEGKMPYSNINMTLTYPDGVTQQSSLSVTKSGIINGFVSLNDVSPSGLYVVDVSFLDGVKHKVLRTNFVLVDDEGLIEIIISRNSVISCLPPTDTDNVDIVPGCTDPNITHIPKTFGIRFFNDDYNTHQMNVGGKITDIILPRGDEIVYPEKTGNYTYHCMIHPWVGGEINVTDISLLQFKQSQHLEIDPILQEYGDSNSDVTIPQRTYDESCSMCYVGIVTKIVDGDTIHVDGKSVRLALVDTPEKRDEGFEQATEHTKNACPVGLNVLVDLDDMQPHDKFGRQIAKVTCGDVNINASLLESGNASVFTSYCMKSEFMYESWAGCNHKITPDVVSVLDSANDTITLDSTNDTALVIQNVSEPDVKQDGIIFIFLSVIIVFIVLCIIFAKKSNSHSPHIDLADFKILE